MTSFRYVAALAISLVLLDGAAMAQGTKPPLLDADGLLPPRHDPASVPAADGSQDKVPAVPMTERTRQAIGLFDSGAVSERHYDLINCLDGMTFGFANDPQAHLPAFFQALRKDGPTDEALVRRFLQVFQNSPEARNAFAKKAGLDAARLDADAIRTGIDRLISSRTIQNMPPPGSTCPPAPRPGASFFWDNKEWFVPAAGRAFRDPAVVAFQVRQWEQHLLEPAARDAKAIGFDDDGPGVFLLAFIRSNPGQVSQELRRLMNAKQPPETLVAGGAPRSWSKVPDTLAKAAPEQVALEKWRELLLWQAICRGNGNRMRSRTIAFYERHLADRFVLFDRNKVDDPENCKPEKTSLR